MKLKVKLRRKKKKPVVVLPSLIIKDLPPEVREELMKKYCELQGYTLK